MPPIAQANDERFFKEAPESMNGFAVVADQGYATHCGECHFAYLPGFLPVRSWTLIFSRLDKHFGDKVVLADDVRARLERYASENAADRSDYEGSKRLLANLSDQSTPSRVTTLPLFGTKHAIAKKFAVAGTRKGLTNCLECHTKAAQGSFGLSELSIPGR